MPGSAGFWDRHARGYAKRPVANEAAYRRKLEATQRYLRPDMEVLEIGCGTGTTALFHAPFVKHLRATDISAKMIAIAEEKKRAEGISNVTFEQLPVEEIAAGPGTYDAVMAHSLLHLVDDKQALIERLYAWLKPGGIFVASTACLGGMMPILRVVVPAGHALGLLPKVGFFTTDQLVDAMTSAGFEIVERWQPSPKEALFTIARKPAA